MKITERCPHCGGELKVIKQMPFQLFNVQCKNAICHYAINGFSTKSNAVAFANKRASPWVRCADMTPMPDVPVLALTKSGAIYVAWYEVSEMDNEFWNDDIGRKPHTWATHWMPLPEPPEVQP